MVLVTAEVYGDRASWPDLVRALEQARRALSQRDSADAAHAMAAAYTCATELYARLNPTRAVVCAHVQGLLETCMARIEHAQRQADGAALDAALCLVQYVQPAAACFTE